MDEKGWSFFKTVSQNGEVYQAASPLGTKLGPWLFIMMINDLHVNDIDSWKYVDDTPMAKIIQQNAPSYIQSAIDNLVQESSTDHFQLSEDKCTTCQFLKVYHQLPTHRNQQRSY